MSEAGNLVCDLDGVVYLHREPIAGAGAALRELAALGYRMLFVTNAATTTPGGVAERISHLSGYSARPEQVLTSALAAARLLADDRPPCYVLGMAAVTEALADAGVPVVTDWRAAEAVVVGLDWDLSYQRLRDACLALRSGARFVATNDDPTFPAPEGQWPGAGAIVAALERATGRLPEPAGKPHAPMRTLVRERLGPGPTWVVGDRPSTDLAMAKTERWRAVLVLSGVTRPDEPIPDRYAPDLVVARLADLPQALAQRT